MPSPPSGLGHETGTSRRVLPCAFSRTATGVRLRRSGNNSWPRQAPGRAQSPPGRIVTHLQVSQLLARLTRRAHPGAHPAQGPRQGAGGMLSSLPIGRGRVGRPTSIYTRTPLPRVRQDARPLVISTSRSPSLVYPVFPAFPSRRWITCKPTLPNWCQLPRSSSAHAPRPPDLERRRTHLRTMKDPVTRTDSPYTDPSVKGPRSQRLIEGNTSLAATSTSALCCALLRLFAPCRRPCC